MDYITKGVVLRGGKMRLLCGKKRHTYKGVRAFLTDEKTIDGLQVVEVFPKDMGKSSFYEGELNAFDYFEKKGYAIYMNSVHEASNDAGIKDWLTLYNKVEEVVI